jgi:hypothetical protein
MIEERVSHVKYPFISPILTEIETCRQILQESAITNKNHETPTQLFLSCFMPTDRLTGVALRRASNATQKEIKGVAKRD